MMSGLFTFADGTMMEEPEKIMRQPLPLGMA